MAAAASSEAISLGWDAVDESYKPLQALYLAFLVLWSLSAFAWAVNTWRNRHFQLNKLQWVLASVPLIKAVQLGSSFWFWYSCINQQLCSLWMSFGAYVTGVLFQTTSFVSFMLISHGYCIMCERLSVSERRSTAILGLILYLTLVGYKAAVPYFTVLLLLNYLTSFYVIFRYISRNLVILREQLSCIEDEDIRAMHDVIQSKYTMFKKFQIAMQIVAVTEIVVHIQIDDATNTYWLRLLIREWAQFCIFLYIGWTFRSRIVSPHFSVMPTLKSKGDRTLPPIYRIEMDAMDFKDLSSQEWQIGVPTSFPSACYGNADDSLLIIVQHPHSLSRNDECPSNQKLSPANGADSYCRIVK